MGTKSKSLALIIVALFLTSLLALSPVTVKAQSSSTTFSSPAMEWQQVYNSQVLESSNLIQTIDGGYVFMDIGYTYQSILKPSTIFKVDLMGNMQWNKTFNLFTGSTVIQTNDEGYEISGWWHPNGTYSTKPTLIKTDSQGNIQWNENYTTLPDLGINFSKYMFPYASGYERGSSIRTSDGGFAYWTDGNITKSDLNNSTQWVKTLTYYTIDAYPTYQAPLTLTSVIETSDGGMAALGVGPNAIDNRYTGRIYLVKIETFLPMPSQTPLPSALATLSPTPSQVPINGFALIVPISIVVFVIAIISLLLYRRHRKTVNLKQ